VGHGGGLQEHSWVGEGAWSWSPSPPGEGEGTMTSHARAHQGPGGIGVAARWENERGGRVLVEWESER
jgi:hypothetical protein